MAYCTLPDVEARMVGPSLTSSSTPTQSEALDMITDIASEIDAALASHGLTTPVTTPSGFVAWLLKVNAEGAAASALTARYADDRGPNSNTAAARMEKRYQDNLARLWDGTAIPSALSVSSVNLPTSYSVEYPDEDPELGEQQMPAFGQAFAL